MKTIQEYINESTRILITINKSVFKAGHQIKLEASEDSNKFYKGNKNNVASIVFETTEKTKCNYENVNNVIIKSITLCDDSIDNKTKTLKENDLKDLNCIYIEKESNHYNIYACKSNGSSGYNNEYSYYYIPVLKLYKNTLGETFNISV